MRGVDDDPVATRTPRGLAGARLRLAVAAFVVLLLGVAVAPGLVERVLCTVEAHSAYVISSEARALHQRLVIGDWHADSLLWARDLLQRGERGHVDLPRLIEGNVALQMFTAVTKLPVGVNYERTGDGLDMVTALAVLQGWPPATWLSLRARALHQGRRLHAFADRAPETLVVIRSADDLERLLRARASGARTVGGLLGIEGAHAFEGDLASIETLYDAGFRMVGLHHFFDNELGGSLHGLSRAGLTEFGRASVRRLEDLEIVVDLAHSSPAVVDDVLAMARRPVVVSHTGLFGACPTPRNLADEQLVRIASAGGLIGIGYWDGAVCDPSPEGVVRSIRRAIDVLGVDHVALGSDFDGATHTYFDTAELAVLTQTMLDAGFEEEEIRKVMGANTERFLRTQLPARSEPD